MAHAMVGAMVVVHIRDAIAQDLPRVVEIERLAFATPWSLKSFEREMTLPFSRISLAILDSGIAAGFLCRWLVADECHILNVAVHPEYRRQGIGIELMKATIAEAAEKQATCVTLEVRRSNVGARRLYRKLNFEERRLRRHYYGPGEDAIVMELEIGEKGGVRA